MKKKSQIELLMPINEDIAGQHRTNKDVNNADDPEGTPGKSFTDDDFSEDDLKKEALGLFDIPAGAVDGMLNFRGRDSYKEEDFETSNKTGFGGESVIDIDEDEHPINIQRRDEFNSANNDENRKKDFFSFLGFKSTGRSMNKELEKLASVLSKSGYPEVSDRIIKTAIPHLVIPLGFWLASGGAAAAAAGGSFYDWNTNNKNLLNRIGADQENSVEEIYEKYKNYLRNYDLVYGLGEWPRGHRADGLKLVGKLQRKFDKGQSITESEFEDMCDSITEDDINFFDDEAFFVNAHNEIVKLRGMAIKADKARLKDPDAEVEHDYTMGDKHKEKQEKKDKKKKKDEEERLTKEQQEERDRKKEEALKNAKIVQTWYDDLGDQVLGRDEFGRIQVRGPKPDFKFVFIDGYPGAGWEQAFDKDNRLWRASDRYKVMQYEDDSGKFVHYPFKGGGSKSASIGVNAEMVKRSISKRDNIVKFGSSLSAEQKRYFEKNKKEKLEDIKDTAVLQALSKNPGEVQKLWASAFAQAKALEEKYGVALKDFVDGMKYDPGAFGKGSMSGLHIPSSLKPGILKEYRWWRTSSSGLTKYKVATWVGKYLTSNGVSTSGDGNVGSGFDLDQSNWSHFGVMVAAAKQWDALQAHAVSAYSAVKLKGGSVGSSGHGGSIGTGKTGTPKAPLGIPKQVWSGKDAEAGVMRYEDQANAEDSNGEPKYGYGKPFYWVCTAKGARQCKTFALLGAGDFGKDMVVGWGLVNNRPALLREIGGNLQVWTGSTWENVGKTSSVNHRHDRLMKIGLKKTSNREARLIKLSDKKKAKSQLPSGIVLPKTFGGIRGKKNTPKGKGTKSRSGSGGGSGTCGVAIQSNLNKAHFMTGLTTDVSAAQGTVNKYRSFYTGAADGRWGPCSHSAWLLFLGDMTTKTPTKRKKDAPAILALVEGMKTSKVTSKNVADAAKIWGLLGFASPGAAGSVATLESILDASKKEESGKTFTDDLLIKYLLSDSLYEKAQLRNNAAVQTLILEYGTKILRTKVENVDGKRVNKSGTSIYARFPQKLRREFMNLFELSADKGIEGTAPRTISFDWKFLKYRAGSGNYILTDIISDHRDLVIANLKAEVCKQPDPAGQCQERRLRDLKAEPTPRTNIQLEAEISAAKVESETADSRAQATNQANMGKISSLLFNMAEKVDMALISLKTEGSTYISSNGARITQSENMADMMSENLTAGKIESIMKALTTGAADRFKAKIFSDLKIKKSIESVLSKVKVVDGKAQISQAEMTLIDEGIAREHGGPNWRAGYLFEIIIKDKSMLKETDSSWWDLGIGVDTRKDIINEYRQQASNPENRVSIPKAKAKGK